jgi:ATP-dependent DNA helicase RecG
VVSAFLNLGGGRVFLGIGDKGELVGVPDAPGLVRRIENQLPKLISPWALWTVEQLRVSDRDVVVVEVPEGMDKPYVAGGAIYFRRGDRVLPATRDEISALIHKRSEASQRWERQVALGSDYEDLDEKLIRETARMAVESERWQGSSDDPEAFLHALGLIANGGITNAAILLYGKNPARVLPQARVRLLVMPEGKTGDRYTLDKMFEGCLLHIAQQIPVALSAYAGGVESTFSSEDWQRADRPRYPMTALREGIMNALVHRDYESSGSITISISPDSLRISNPGGLPDELKLPDLKRDHPSLPRNPDIAHICFLHRLIEKVGRGTQRIIEDCRKAHLKEPKWSSSPLETSLTFYSPAIGVNPEELTERQGRILEILKSKGTLKASEMAELLGGNVTGRTVRNDLFALLEQQLIVRRGQGPSTTYSSVRSEVNS